MKKRKIVLTGIGADIEVFLQNTETGEIVSAEGIIKGSKYDPFIFEPPFFSTSLDNVLAEFTIPPSQSPDDFINNIRKGLDYINSSIPSGLKAISLPAAIMDYKYLESENAMTFGCEPDFNAYTRDINYMGEVPDWRLRSAGGHIHIGYSDATPFDSKRYIPDDERVKIVKALDLFVGVPSIIAEEDNERKLLYGKAGSFRPKPYGVEYRTPSNFYAGNDDLTGKIFQSVKRAIDWVNEGNEVDDSLSIVVEEAINLNDKETAMELISEYSLTL